MTDPAPIVRYLCHLGERTGAPVVTRAQEPLPIVVDEAPPDDWV